MTLDTSTRPRSAKRARTAGLTVAITGARGAIGPALLARLLASDAVGRIRTLGRLPVPEAEAEPRIDFRPVDVRDPDATRRSLSGADIVVHMAFALYGVREREPELFATNVEGTANVARGAVAAGARRFVYTSSVAVYGPRPGQERPLSEDDSFHAPPRLFYARHKAQSELVLREAVADADIDTYVFRPCTIVGPHATGAPVRGLPDALKSVGRRAVQLAGRFGARPVVPAPPVPLQFVHEDDVAQALERAILGSGPPSVYNLAGDGTVNGPDAVRMLGLRLLPLPHQVVSAGLRAVAALPPLVPASGWPSLLAAPLLVDTTRARQDLGWAPRFSSGEALLDTRRAAGW